MYDVNLTIPVIEGFQAGEKFYIGMCRLKTCARMFTFVSELVPPQDRMQRLINLTRVRAIAKYLDDRREDYILPPIIVLVNGSMNFQSFSDEFTEMGMLTINTESPIFISDGQHRVKAITQAIDQDESLGEDTIPVVFFRFKGIKEAQTIFVDINSKAKATTTTLNKIYDHKDPVSKVTRQLLVEVPILDRLCEQEKNSTSGKSPYLFPFKDLYRANKIIYNALMKTDQPPELETLEQSVSQYWRIVADLMSSWQEVDKQQLSAERCRFYNISSHGITLEALGEIGRQLLLEGSDQQKLKQQLAPLAQINWNKNSPKIRSACMNLGKVVKNRGTTAQLVILIKTQLKLA